MFGDFFKTCAFLGTWVVEIKFIEHDQAGLFLVLNHACDLAVLRGDALRTVDDQKAEVGAADRSFGAHGGENFHGRVHLGSTAEAGRIDEGVALAKELVGDIDGVASRPCNFGYDGAVVLKDSVDER